MGACCSSAPPRQPQRRPQQAPGDGSPPPARSAAPAGAAAAAAPSGAPVQELITLSALPSEPSTAGEAGWRAASRRRGSECKVDQYEGTPGEWLCIGSGSFGKVYKARHRASSDWEAVKVIVAGDDEDFAEMEREVEILRNVARECPHVVQYRGCSLHSQAEQPGDSCQQRLALWIAMEYCGGGALDAVAGLLTEEQVAWACRDALLGLAYLHERGVLHRDVKGGNLLISSPGGRVKLADFGVSARMQSVSSLRRTLVGTALWMAPEVIEAGEAGYDARADIWSLGVTALEIAEGAPPHAQRHFRLALCAICRGPVPRLRRRLRHTLHGGVCPGGRLHEGVLEDGATAELPPWSDAFADFIAAALTRDPAIRPAAAELGRTAFPRSAPDPSRPDAAGLLATAQSVRTAREAERSGSASGARQLLLRQGVTESPHGGAPSPATFADTMRESLADLGETFVVLQGSAVSPEDLGDTFVDHGSLSPSSRGGEETQPGAGAKARAKWKGLLSFVASGQFRRPGV